MRHTLSATTAPFATAAETISGASWVGALVAFLVVVSATLSTICVPLSHVGETGITDVSFVVSVLFIVHSANTDAEGLAVHYPFLYALGAFLLGVPVYLLNRKRMTPPPGPPPPVDAVSTAPVAA